MVSIGGIVQQIDSYVFARAGAGIPAVSSSSGMMGKDREAQTVQRCHLRAFLDLRR